MGPKLRELHGSKAHLTFASNDSHAAKKIRMAHSTATNVKNALRPVTAVSVVLRKPSVSWTVMRSSSIADRRPFNTRCEAKHNTFGDLVLHIQ